MNSEEKVSVIIPVYNDEKYLEQCVMSAVNQTYSNLEIILIDDGSTDSSPIICEQLKEKDERIRVLHKQNGGVGSSRNAGLSMATGEYVLFIDDDDWIEADHIEKLFNLLKKNDADIAIGNFMVFKENIGTRYLHITEADYFEKSYTPEEWFEIEYQSRFWMNEIFVVPWAKLYKRSLLTNIMYPEDKMVEDDLTTWKIYLLADKISYINSPIYTQRLLDTSVTAQSKRTDVFPIEAVEKRLALLKILGFDTSMEESAYLCRLNICKEDSLKNKDLFKYQDTIQKMKILKKYRKI